MNQIEEIEKMLLPVLEQNHVQLYECKWNKMGKSKVLTVAIMNEDGEMDIDTCQKVSESLSDVLDAHEDMIPFEYMLEVCSPGAERALRNHDEIVKAVGKHIYVKLIHAVKGSMEFTGDLLEVTEDTLTIQYADKAVKRKVSIKENEIELIRLAVKF